MAAQHQTRTESANSIQGPDPNSSHAPPVQGPGSQPSSITPLRLPNHHLSYFVTHYGLHWNTQYLQELLRWIAAQHQTGIEPASSLQGPTPVQGPGSQPSSTTPVQLPDVYLSYMNTRNGEILYEAPSRPALPQTRMGPNSVQGHSPRYSPLRDNLSYEDRQITGTFTDIQRAELPTAPRHTLSTATNQLWLSLETIQGPMMVILALLLIVVIWYCAPLISPAGLNISRAREEGRQTVQTRPRVDSGVASLNEGGDKESSKPNQRDLFPETVQGPRREAELALSNASTEGRWRTLRLNRRRGSGEKRFNKASTPRDAIWRKLAKKIDTANERTSNQRTSNEGFEKEFKNYCRRESKKVWQGWRRLDRVSRWQAMRNSAVFVPEGGCLYCADDNCNGCTGY